MDGKIYIVVRGTICNYQLISLVSHDQLISLQQIIWLEVGPSSFNSLIVMQFLLVN